MLGVVAAGGLLCACGGGKGADALVIYNGQHPQTTEALASAFQSQTGISVAVRDGDEDVFANQLVAEGAHSPADLFIAENSPALQYLSKKGLLAKDRVSTIDRTPQADRAPAGDWVGVSVRVSVLVYNTSLVAKQDLPTSVLDLAAPKWAGKLALAPSESDFQPVITAVIRSEGRAAALRWLEALKANAGEHLYPDNETLVAKVNSGQAAIGVVNQYYWYRLRVQEGAAGMHSALAFFAPRDPGYVVNISGAAVLKSSAHQAAAQEFLAFLTSAKGQSILAGGDSFEYPILPGVSARDQEPLALLQPYPISVADLGDGSEALALLQAAQLL
jgi:iron(III) transport system substrate-binding protein